MAKDDDRDDDRQDDMFDMPFGTDPKKLARTGDPSTSHAAARATNTAKWEQIVLEAIRSFGTRGATQDEIIDWVHEKYGWQPYSTVTARFKALEEKGYIIYTGETRKSKSGRQSRVRVAAEYY
jgi:hypothetical protein